MNNHYKIIGKLKKKLINDSNNFALLVTGSVARGDATNDSDLDLMLITQKPGEFTEKVIDGILVEIKSNTFEGYIEKMTNAPMNVYQWLDAKVVFDKMGCFQQLFSKANEICHNYDPGEEEVRDLVRWLSSVQTKIKSAQKQKDNLLQGYNTSNVLWKVIEGLYLLNNKPLPPSTTAFNRIKYLGKLPSRFPALWSDLLTGNSTTRSDATLKIIDFVLSKLKPG